MSQSNSIYNHILVGLDLSEESSLVIDKAISLARMCGAQLSIAHVIEPITFAYGGDMPLDISEVQEQQVEKAEQELKALAKKNRFSCSTATRSSGATCHRTSFSRTARRGRLNYCR
jgi:nucleotide-binding universal stress UspA family protein